jgi:hypothetical protein
MPRRANASGAPAADPLLTSVEGAVAQVFGHLRRSVQRNLAVLAVAFLRLLSGARSGHGRLSLGALFRVLPTAGTAHAREKRLARFLNNPRLDARGVTSGLARIVFGARGAGCWPILLDQTCSGATQALVAGVPFEGRALPLGVYTFDYPWQEPTAGSQNQLERVFLLDVEGALPATVRPVWIADRGYARAALLAEAEREERFYVIRGRVGTCIEYDGRRQKLAGLAPGPDGAAVRYVGVQYQARRRVRVDVIVVHDPAFAEPWALLVPPESVDVLPTALVVALYRERMQVEHTFRDFKTHLGLRGLQLRVRIAERTGRLLLAFCLAYALAVILGSHPEAAGGRADLEIPRRTPRHGTCRTLSVLSVATQMLAHPRWTRLAQRVLHALIRRLARGQPALMDPPPDLDARLAIA